MTPTTTLRALTLAACAVALTACADRPQASATAVPVAAAADWCGGHDVPESACTLCNPELIPAFREAGDWCAPHGLPESVCPLCDHGAADWCAGHGVPESACTLCNPELIPAFREAGDWCAEHGLPESVCPECGHGASPPQAEAATLDGLRVRLREPGHEQVLGLRTETVLRDELATVVECTADLDFDRDRIAGVRAPLPGVVQEVLVDLGDPVGAGDAIAVLASPEAASLQGDLRAARERLLTARANHEREEHLHRTGIAPLRHLELARQELEAAEGAVAASREALEMGGAGEGDGGRCVLRAPAAGTVLRRPVTVGEVADRDRVLAVVGDTSTMWAMLRVPERDASRVRVGQPVEVWPEGSPERAAAGRITWVSPEVDVHSRTVAARAELANPDGALRAGGFARARIEVSAPTGGVTVPHDAVQRIDGDDVVFVRRGTGLYEPRPVTLHERDGERVRVRGAVAPGDEVVTAGAILLRTEMERENLGAGCCELVPPSSGG